MASKITGSIKIISGDIFLHETVEEVLSWSGSSFSFHGTIELQLTQGRQTNTGYIVMLEILSLLTDSPECVESKTLLQQDLAAVCSDRKIKDYFMMINVILFVSLACSQDLNRCEKVWVGWHFRRNARQFPIIYDFHHLDYHSRQSSTDTYIDNSKSNCPIYQPLRSGRIWHKVNF